MTQFIITLAIMTTCTLLAVATGTFKNPFIQLLLAGFVTVILADSHPTLPVLLWSTIGGLSYVLGVDFMCRKMNDTPPFPSTRHKTPPRPTARQSETSIHDLFEFEPLGEEQ